MSRLDRFVLSVVFIMCAGMAVGGIWLGRQSACAVAYSTTTTFAAGTPVTNLQADVDYQR